MKKLWKRAFSYLLVCFSFFMICAPGVYATQPVETNISVALGGEFAAGVEGDVSTMDDLLALAVSGYFGANGIALVNYNQSRESYVDMIIRYFKEYYSAQVEGATTRDFYDWLANNITETAFGIQRVAGAVTGAANLLIGEPLAQVLEPFKNWWNNKFNPQATVETAQTVEIVRDTSVAAVTVPLVDGGSIALCLSTSGDLLVPNVNYVNYYNAGSAGWVSVISPVTNFSLGTPLFDVKSVSKGVYSAEFENVSVVVDNGMLTITKKDTFQSASFGITETGKFYLAGLAEIKREGGVIASYSGAVVIQVRDNSGYYAAYRFWEASQWQNFYLSSGQFEDSGVSVTTMSVSSDGSLSYGPDTSEADNIVQNAETLSVPIIAPSVSGSSLSFSASDTLAELVEKALQSVTSFLTDVSSNTLELPSNDTTLSPDISIEANIDWADDTASEVTPTPTITPGAIVTVAPTSGVTPWPVSEQQIAVLGSDGQIAIVDVVQTIKGWTQSLTEVYQGYVNLISAVFPFLPDELIVLLNWSLAALIFTGLFKRWWWSHH